MPVRKGKADKPVLIFDAFARVHPTNRLIVAWPEVVLDTEEQALLDALLHDLGFLGRAESWVEALRLPEWDGEVNCTPGELGLDIETGELREPISLIAPTPAEDYAAWRLETVESLGLTAKKLKKAQSQVLTTLPERLIDALRLDTGDIQAAGWSRPPGARFITYHRPDAFYLPEANADGRIDHVLIHATAGLDHRSLEALDRINRIWERGGAEWQVLFERYGEESDFADLPSAGCSTTWQSLTPYLHPWFRKKKLTVEDQIRRECRERGLPAPELQQLAAVRIKGRDRRSIHFHRFRNKRGLRQPDTQGSFWRLTFPEPVCGPLALGFACHYGLGMFRRTGVESHNGKRSSA